MKKRPVKTKFNFERLREEATHTDVAVRIKAFTEYFEMFNEFPSYLYDNSLAMDDTLFRTIEHLKNDPETSKRMQTGIELLFDRLPSPRT